MTTPTPTYEVTFRGGGRLTGTATEILTAWGAMAYPPHKPDDVEAIKIDLSKRAWIWAGDDVDPFLDDDSFVVAIGRTRMVAGFATTTTALRVVTDEGSK